MLPSATRLPGKIPSAADDRFYSGREFKDMAIRPPVAASINRPAPRFAMRGSEMAQPSITLIQAAIAQRQQVRMGKSLVVGQIGNAWRGVGGSRKMIAS